MPTAKLHDYQITAKNFIIAHPRCGLFMDMGLGKTLTTLSAISEINPTRHVLVVAPKTIARSTWIDEIKEWQMPLRYKSLIVNENGTALTRKQRHDAYQQTLNELPSIYFINRELLADLIDNCPVRNGHKQWPFGTLIIDESQSFKSHTAIKFQKLKLVLPCFERVILLSGTPAPQGPMDLWSQIYLLDYGARLGKNITTYRKTFFYESMFMNNICIKWEPKENAEDYIYNAISDIVISQKNTKIKLPPLTFNDIHVHMDPKEAGIYKKMMKENVLTIDGTEIVAKNAAVLTAKLSQMASGALYTDAKKHEYTIIHQHKCECCRYIIENTDSPVLIAYHFQSDMQMILDYLAKNNIQTTVFDKTPEMIAQWNRKEIPVMLLQPASAGHGINIQTGGHTLIWYTMPWSLEEYLQTNARLYRQGQTEPVIIHRLLTKGTVDTRILKCLEDKNTTQDALLDAVNMSLKDMNEI